MCIRDRSGDNNTFGNADKINYIDKGGTTFPYDDIESIDSIDSYMLRTKVSSIGDNESKPLGFVTYNPSKSATWAAGDALASNSTTIGNNTLQPGILYTLTFYAQFSAQYYNYVSNNASGDGHADFYPFLQIYSDSVTDLSLIHI